MRTCLFWGRVGGCESRSRLAGSVRAKVALRWHGASGNGGPSYEKPQPVPLGDAEAQREFEELQRQFSIVSESLARRGVDGFEGARQEDENIDEKGRNKVTGEVNGPKGKEPTRFGDWERKGRVSDF